MTSPPPSSTPQEAASSSIVGKVIKIGVMVTVGLGIASVIDLIKSDTGAGKKKCPMDQETKDKLDLVLNALDGVTGIACKAFLGRCYCCCLFLCYVCSMLLLLLLLIIIILLIFIMILLREVYNMIKIIWFF